MADIVTKLHIDQMTREWFEAVGVSAEHIEGYISVLRRRLDRDKRFAELEAQLIDTTASLVAATSLLSRSPKTAAPSDKMFDQMLKDYQRSIDHARAALAKGGTG